MSAFRLVLEADVSRDDRDPSSLYESLLADPTQIGTFLSDDSSRVMFLENFQTYVDNLLRFLEYNATLERTTSARSVAYEAISLAVCILSFSEFDLIGHALRRRRTVLRLSGTCFRCIS